MTAAAPETPATPGQAAYEAYLAHLQGADPGYGQWVKPFAAIDKHDRDAWEAAALAARQPQPAPGLPQSAYLYHCKFGGLGGDEYGLFWRKEDADAAAANRAGEGCTQVLGMAILGDRPESQPAPLSASQVRRHAEQAAPGELATLLADWRKTADSLKDRRGAGDARERNVLEVVIGQVEAAMATHAQPAPVLAAAMAETRQLRTALRTLASLWDASSDKDEETGARPNRARLVFEERATVRRNCAADIRKLAGPEGK